MKTTIAESPYDGGHKLWEIFEVTGFDPVKLGDRLEISRALLTAREAGKTLKCVKKEIDVRDGMTFAIHDFAIV